MNPVRGKLSGDKARPVMMASKLPVDALGKIWNLSDIDKDGQLDSEEFAVVSFSPLSFSFPHLSIPHSLYVYVAIMQRKDFHNF